jgi:outer membrane protein
MSAFTLSAQQITLFAVVDLEKIYAAFKTDTKAMRDFEDKSAKMQAEVDRRTAEIKDLMAQKADISEDSMKAERIEAEITKKAAALKSYYEVESKKLEDQRSRSSVTSDFAGKVLNEIRYIAESGGYSIVLNLKDNRSILWYAQAIDVTDKVILSLKKRLGS